MSGSPPRRSVIPGSRILVVDDNALIRESLREHLTARGHEVTTSDSGDDALRRLRHTPPDLVILDLRLPGLDGLEVVRRLRSAPATLQLPVIALTAYAHAHSREEALGAGCDAFFTKPLDPEALDEQVDLLLRQTPADRPRPFRRPPGQRS